MFESIAHDFGTAEENLPCEYSFTLKNSYQETACIAGVRAYCGCAKATIVKIGRVTLKTGESASIEAVFRTRGDTQGKEQATITIVFDQPVPAEV